MLKFFGTVLTALCVMFAAFPVYAATPNYHAPWEECYEQVFDDRDLAKAAVLGSQEAFNRQQDMLVLCAMYDPDQENWAAFQGMIESAKRTGDRDAYLTSLGVSVKELEPVIEQMRIFHARQAYARLYETMHWQQPVSQLPENLYELYSAYGALLDPSDPYRRRYGEVFDKATPESLVRVDKLLGFDAAVKVGDDLQCSGYEPYLGYSGYELIIICKINEWPPPVYPLVEPPTE